jgi:hypothetical protein
MAINYLDSFQKLWISKNLKIHKNPVAVVKYKLAFTKLLLSGVIISNNLIIIY